jgi:peptidoglycan/xylan/chitin deacetylase (PgdA/CDA1 family)
VRPLVAAAVRLRGRWPLPAGPAAVVVGWHQVERAGTKMAVAPEIFGRQVEILARHQREIPVMALADAAADLARGRRDAAASRPGTCRLVLTFDDAWADNHAHALGPLTRHGLPATLYAPSRLLGRPGYMSPGQLQEMSAAGIAIGAHSRTHPDLRRCSPAELDSEVRGGKDDLEDLLGVPVTSFAYPAGLLDDRVVAAVAAAGFTSAVTTRPGWWLPSSPVLRIPRAFMEEFSDATCLAASRGGLGILRVLDALRRAGSRNEMP